jgi:hypothetical protein
MEPNSMTAYPTPTATVLNHVNKLGRITIRDAMNDYGLSGGHLTKIVSNLRKQGYDIGRVFKRHPLTGRRYASYSMVANWTVKSA